MPYTSGIRPNIAHPTHYTSEPTQPVTKSAPVGAADSAASNSTSAPARAAAPVSTDHAILSASATLLSQGLSGADADVRSEKIAALQQSIAAGTYHVSASAVAEKVIGSMLG